jgi:drug/metabolite transporter (DMT)-like permease
MSRSSDPAGTRPATPSAGRPPPSAQTHASGLDSRGDTTGRHRLSVASMALLLFAVATAAIGQVMLKHGMQVATSRAAHRGSLVASAATSPWVLLGLLVFAISAIAWLATLSRVPLSVAYPFNALGYLGILTASILILHERANVLTWAGSLLVVSGLIIVVLARP